MTVLILDGHAGVRDALARLRRRTRTWRVVAADADVDTALLLITEWEPAVVLYDPRTVPGDPLAVLPRLVRTGRPVVILTSSLHEGEEALLTAGAAAVLLKGGDSGALPGCVAEPRQPRTQAPSRAYS